MKIKSCFQLEPCFLSLRHYSTGVLVYDKHTNAWSELPCRGDVPIAKGGITATVVKNTLWVHGGQGVPGKEDFYSTTCILDLRSQVWSAPQISVRRCKLDPNLKAPPGFKGSQPKRREKLAFNLNLVGCLSLRHCILGLCAALQSEEVRPHLRPGRDTTGGLIPFLVAPRARVCVEEP